MDAGGGGGRSRRRGRQGRPRLTGGGAGRLRHLLAACMTSSQGCRAWLASKRARAGGVSLVYVHHCIQAPTNNTHLLPHTLKVPRLPQGPFSSKSNGPLKPQLPVAAPAHNRTFESDCTTDPVVWAGLRSSLVSAVLGGTRSVPLAAVATSDAVQLAVTRSLALAATQDEDTQAWIIGVTVGNLGFSTAAAPRAHGGGSGGTCSLSTEPRAVSTTCNCLCTADNRCKPCRSALWGWTRCQTTCWGAAWACCPSRKGEHTAGC